MAILLFQSVIRPSQSPLTKLCKLQQSDLGIDVDNIKQKAMLVLRLKKPTHEVVSNPDLSGPIAIALLLGVLLLFSGKIHFGDIYGVSIIGTILLYFLMNFMSEVNSNTLQIINNLFVTQSKSIIPVYDVMSVLGYNLIPMLLLGFINILFNLKGPAGVLVAPMLAGWSSASASNFFEQVLELKNKKWLVAYPVFLFYMTFVIITIF